MSMSVLKCAYCPRRFDSVQASRDHVEGAHEPEARA